MSQFVKLSPPQRQLSVSALHHAREHWVLSLIGSCLIYIVLRYLRVLYQRYVLNIRTLRSPEPQRPPLVLPAIPYVGHFISNAISFQGYMNTLARRYPRCSALSLPMMSSTHHVVIAPSLVHQVLTAPKITNKFTGEPFFFGLMEKVFGDEQQLMRNMDQELLWGPVSKSVQGMMRESFLKPALELLNEGVSRNVCRMITFERDISKQQLWERAAFVKPSEDSKSANASLHPLLRDFVGDLAITILLGPDFLENFPNALPDLFALDATFSILLSGMPHFLTPSIGPGLTARAKLLEALRQHHVAYMRYIEGADPGPKWSRVSQTSSVLGDRIKAFAEAGDFDVSKPEEQKGMISAVGNLVVLWALNVNANQVTFWMIFHIYSDAQLLAQIRRETDCFVACSESDHKAGAQVTKISLPGLLNDCPLLMGAFLETMRWESGATTYRCIREDFLLTESIEDARIFGHQVPQTYIFKKDEYIILPNGTHQGDERYFAGAQKFDARRFWVRNESEAKQPVEADIEDEEAVHSNWNRSDTPNLGVKMKSKTQTDMGKIRVDYKTMHPWGGGSTVCKGKRFAEGEVLTFVAAIIANWDIERIDLKGKKIPDWGSHPGHKTGTGAVVPASDVLVRIRRRATPVVE